MAYFAFGAAAAAAQGKLVNDTGPSWTILMTLVAAATVLLYFQDRYFSELSDMSMQYVTRSGFEPRD